MPVEQPLKPLLIKVHSCLDSNDLSTEEKKFLRLVEGGNFVKIQRLLEKHHETIDLDCCDCRGYRALDIAVTQRKIDLVRFLLMICTFSKDHVQGSLLRAVDTNSMELVEILLERCEELESSEEEYATQKHLELSPIMLASINENFEMIRLFVHKGYHVAKPHLPSCVCFQCREEASSETLKESLARIAAYRALASPTYIVSVNKDPILTAFKLSYEASILAVEYPEHQDIYQQISKKCSQFAADFLLQCRNTEEAEILLMQKNGLQDIRNHRFNRLCLAVQYKQKTFISHPICQQVLYATWVEGLSSWRKLSAQRKALHVISQCLMTPVVCTIHILLPRAEIIKPMKVPLNRFIYYVTSYFVFLTLLLATLFWDSRQDIREPAVWPRFVADVWVLGYVMEVVVKIWSMGLRHYLRLWWHRFDLVMHILFMLSESISIIVYLYSYFHSNDIKWNRMELPWYHPLLISEGLFGCALVMAFCRVLFWYQSQSKLGPLGTSLTYMMNDVLRFFLIFFVLMLSFGIGINSIYRNYKDSVQVTEDGKLNTQPAAFVSLRETLKTLFWTAFGMGEADYADIIVTGNFTNSSVIDHAFTEDIGYILWGSYHLLSVIVMLNMLIAMMAESYERVQGNADMEWKFARCMIWMSYFDVESTVPPPFNLLPSLRRLSRFIRWTTAKFSRKESTSPSPCSGKRCCSYEESKYGDNKDYEERYEKLLTVLRRRYLDWKKQRDISAVPTSFMEQTEKIKREVVREMKRHSNQPITRETQTDNYINL